MQIKRLISNRLHIPMVKVLQYHILWDFRGYNRMYIPKRKRCRRERESRKRWAKRLLIYVSFWALPCDVILIILYYETGEMTSEVMDMLCPKCKCRNPRCNNYDCTIEVIVRNKAAANVPESESKENWWRRAGRMAIFNADGGVAVAEKE